MPCRRLFDWISLAKGSENYARRGMHIPRYILFIRDRPCSDTRRRIAVLLQLGDSGSVIWVFAMSAHTLIHLFFSRRPPGWFGPVIFVLGWFLTILLPILGPTVIARGKDEPYDHSFLPMYPSSY
jgi:hypothetical protein